MTEQAAPNLVRPYEMRPGQMDWRGHWSTDDIWDMLVASRAGNLQRVRELLDKDSSLVHADYWYVPPIQFAVREGHLDVVKILVESGADTSHRSLDGRESLMDFAQDRGHSQVVDYLQDINPRMFSKDQDIHKAIKSKDFGRTQELLKADRQLVNSPGALGRTPLHYAVEVEGLELVRYLVTNGADIDAHGFSSDDRLGGHGFRPITLALWHHPYWRQRNNYEIARLLIEVGADYSLTIAAALGDKDRVKQLISANNTDPNEEESGGKRPISAAAERNHLDIVEFLLDSGADPNLPEGPNCPRGYALWSAARFGYREVAKLLLEHDADPNAPVESSGSPTESAKDDSMRNLLYQYGGFVGMAAHFHQKNIDVIAALLDRCPERISESEIVEGFTMGVSNDDEDLVRLLLARGKRVPSHVTGCQTYLWHSLRLSELLLQHGMDPNLPNWQLMRPLHHMASKGNAEGAELFLKYGADPTLVDEEYRSTPLGWAARSGQIGFVEFLLGYDPSLATISPEHEPDWASPSAWAERRGHMSIAQLLQAKEID
ncbi:MAG: ankyrin repeat domain-containing protein [Gammaproteobacteria bacterium]|nr:ankyrin repeat domain-containing protein [Gammaproteobacteria bacterium]